MRRYQGERLESHAVIARVGAGRGPRQLARAFSDPVDTGETVGKCTRSLFRRASLSGGDPLWSDDALIFGFGAGVGIDLRAQGDFDDLWGFPGHVLGFLDAFIAGGSTARRWAYCLGWGTHQSYQVGSLFVPILSR